MQVLIVKTSSMGDIIHTLPALTDAGLAIPGIQFDWAVEENFAELPRWHPLVDQIVPVAIRRWRKKMFSRETFRQWIACRRALRQKKYDLVIDAQGLTKSALITLNARGPSVGLSFYSSRDPFATFFYRKRYIVDLKQHAVRRARSLFSQALGYPLSDEVPDYGIDRYQFAKEGRAEGPYLVFLHGTTWPTKHWPEDHWIELANKAAEQGFSIKLPWGNVLEEARALRIAKACSAVEVLPRLGLKDIATILAGAHAIVAVDTGLGHLAAALNVPTVSLYGPTDPLLTGAWGASQTHLTAPFPCAPCFSRECQYLKEKEDASPPEIYPACFSVLTPTTVWSALEKLLHR